MLTRPVGLSDDAVAHLLQDDWGLAPRSIAYLPVGAGSHHWRLDDAEGRSWFVTVDDLDARQSDPSESRTMVFDRLDAALTAARALRDAGAEFVVAPVVAGDGRVLSRLDDRWAVAVYPLVEGETFRGGQAMPAAARLEIVGLVARLHATAASARPLARTDDLALQNRSDLEQAVGDPAEVFGTGPHADELVALVEAHTPLVTRMLTSYDRLVADAALHAGRNVLTHGEPHAGNVMRSATGWVLVDWDTTLLAPPERDLWMLEPGDGSAVEAYTAMTGTEIIPTLLDLFRLRWDLADLGVYIAQIRAGDGTTADDEKARWAVRSILERHAAGATIPPVAWP